MLTTRLGVSSLAVTRLAYGCWRLAGTWDPSQVNPEADARGRQAVTTAFETGYNFFDNADIYCRGHCERILGEALQQVPGMREKILIATKCGIRFADEPATGAPHRYDFSAEHIVRSCEASLKRMKIETIDLYQLHRPDYLADPAEIAAAFLQLQESGKVRYFGVSNFRPSLVTALQAGCPLPLVVNQVEISLARLDCFTDGTLDQCLEKRMTPMAWSPLSRGLLGDGGVSSATESNEVNTRENVIPALDAIANAHGVSRVVVALAWLLKHPSKIVPIVGSTNGDRIRNAATAAGLELSREEWYQLLRAARGTALP